jgi:hypothetical protein
MSKLFLIIILSPALIWAQSYAPPAGQPGSTAIHMDSSIFVAWAADISVERGYLDISNKGFEINGNNLVTFGESNYALGPATGIVGNTVSLGDSGFAVVTFNKPIINGPGNDFAIFENAFNDQFLEFAHVEVSSDGENFVRFPSHSEIQTITQTSGFGATDPRYIHNLAGKYRIGYGTPFDLQDLIDSTEIDLEYITHVKIIDVVGSIQDFGTSDAYDNLINDPFPTPFESGGFDLEAIGVIHQLATTAHNEEFMSKVYPNPVQNVLNINTKNEIEEIIMIDRHGKRILVEEENGFAFSLSIVDLTPGMYFLQLRFVNGEIQNKKIVKTN